MNPDCDFLLDIVELIETIERHRPETEAKLIEDEVLLSAMIHWVQTIGEAAKGVSEGLRAETPRGAVASDRGHAEPAGTRAPPRRSSDRVAGRRARPAGAKRRDPCDRRSARRELTISNLCLAHRAETWWRGQMKPLRRLIDDSPATG